jgi:intraflagellar transport protein 88
MIITRASDVSAKRIFDFNLANAHHLNGLWKEAIQSYTPIVKNKQCTQGGQLRVNMGNIYFEQQQFPTAIRMLG